MDSALIAGCHGVMIDRGVKEDDDWHTVALRIERVELCKALRARGTEMDCSCQSRAMAWSETERSCSYPNLCALTLLEFVQECSDVALELVDLPIDLGRNTDSGLS